MTRQNNDTQDVNESQASEDHDGTREIKVSCENRADQCAGNWRRCLHWLIATYTCFCPKLSLRSHLTTSAPGKVAM
jgi:hypothetical protein